MRLLLLCFLSEIFIMLFGMAATTAVKGGGGGGGGGSLSFTLLSRFCEGENAWLVEGFCSSFETIGLSKLCEVRLRGCS